MFTCYHGRSARTANLLAEAAVRFNHVTNQMRLDQTRDFDITKTSPDELTDFVFSKYICAKAPNLIFTLKQILTKATGGNYIIEDTVEASNDETRKVDAIVEAQAVDDRTFEEIMAEDPRSDALLCMIRGRIFFALVSADIVTGACHFCACHLWQPRVTCESIRSMRSGPSMSIPMSKFAFRFGTTLAPHRMAATEPSPGRYNVKVTCWSHCYPMDS